MTVAAHLLSTNQAAPLSFTVHSFYWDAFLWLGWIIGLMIELSLQALPSLEVGWEIGLMSDGSKLWSSNHIIALPES